MIIDCHVHPPFIKSGLLEQAAKMNGIEFSIKRLESDMKKNDVRSALVYAIYIKEARLTNEQLLKSVEGKQNLLPVASVDPNKIDVAGLEKYFKKKQFAALKLYCGYWNISPTDKRFEPIYSMCQKYKVPAFIHMGDPLVKTASLRYCQPIYIDDLAVAWPKLKIIMCHYGFPWMFDTTEILYKNDNVMADLSGFFVGTTKYTKQATEALSKYITESVWYMGTAEDKILFGSDWPITSIENTINVVNKLDITDEDKEAIFWKNASRLFGIKI